MSNEQTDIARRLVACEAFHWPERLENVHQVSWGADFIRRTAGGMRVQGYGSERLPDLADPATGGILLGMLGDNCIEVLVDRGGCRVKTTTLMLATYNEGTTLAEACALALLSVWS